jgi:integrase
MSVWRDKRGRLHVAIQFRGRRIHRVCPEGTSREQARRFETKIRQDLFRVIDLGEAPEIPLSQAVQRYLDEEVAHHKAARVTTLKAFSLEQFVVGKSLSQIVGVGESIVSALRGQLAPATINRKLAILKRVANLSYKKWGWLKEPLGDKIQFLPGERQRQTYLDAAQVKRLVACCDDCHTKDAVLIAAYTGLRLSELWSVTAEKVRGDAIYLPDSKGGNPRAVPVISKIRAAVKRWVSTERVAQRTFHDHFAAARKRAGLLVRFHDLRHSCASMLANAGVDLYTIGQILGHTRAQTTQRYSHLTMETKRKALRKLG